MQTNDSVKKYLRSWSNSNQWCLFLPKLAPTPSVRMPLREGTRLLQGQAILVHLLSRLFKPALPEDDWVKFWVAIFFPHSAYKVNIPHTPHTQENNMKTRRDKIKCKKTRTPKRSWKCQWRIHWVECQSESSNPKSRKASEPLWGLQKGFHFHEPWVPSTLAQSREEILRPTEGRDMRRR